MLRIDYNGLDIVHPVSNKSKKSTPTLANTHLPIVCTQQLAQLSFSLLEVLFPLDKIVKITLPIEQQLKRCIRLLSRSLTIRMFT